jgi:hypothetical protein
VSVFIAVVLLRAVYARRRAAVTTTRASVCVLESRADGVLTVAADESVAVIAGGALSGFGGLGS